MNHHDVVTCIITNLKKIIKKHQTLDIEQIYDHLKALALTNMGLAYCLNYLDKSRVIYIILDKIKDMSPIKSTPIVSSNLIKDGKSISFKEICEKLNMEPIPHYEVFYNKKICSFVQDLKNQGLNPEWRTVNQNDLALFISPKTDL